MTTEGSTALRRLTPAGIDAVRGALHGMRASASRDISPLLEIAFDDQLAAVIPGTAVPTSPVFSSRFDLAESLHELFQQENLRRHVPNIEDDSGLWTWLALLWSSNLLMKRRVASYPVGRDERWVLGVDDWNRYYKHLLAGPFYVYEAHIDAPERCRVVLAGPPNAPGEMWENIAGRRDLVRNARVMELLEILYLNRKSKDLRKGATTKGAGGVRRLGVVLKQFDLTFDVFSMPPEDLLAILPAEFRKLADAH